MQGASSTFIKDHTWTSCRKHTIWTAQNPQQLLQFQVLTNLKTVIEGRHYAGNMATSRITSDYVILYMVSPVVWFTRKQPIISLSTAESEFIAATECVKKVLFLNSLYKELTGEFTPANLNIDNKSTIQMIKNDSMTKRS
ncbi:hypothetical protein PR048_033770 [Dryococelus australis]|uniref:Uncharacterized protein n=1 Tax=Dryococelus australis TaxID=614101 RepID=A0ABQ9FZ30_9NEOP|nr:hypothetical protein PR048_033770 [Dryococelus australis]